MLDHEPTSPPPPGSKPDPGPIECSETAPIVSTEGIESNVAPPSPTATAEQAAQAVALRTAYEVNPSPELQDALIASVTDDAALNKLYEGLDSAPTTAKQAEDATKIINAHYNAGNLDGLMGIIVKLRHHFGPAADKIVIDSAE